MKDIQIGKFTCFVIATALASAAFAQDQDHRDHHDGNHAPPGQTIGPNHQINSIGFGLGLERARSRSGRVHYGTISNGYSRSIPFSIARPHGLPPAPLRNYQFKHYGGLWYGMRVGYVSYSAGFVDDLFFYPFYSFDPDSMQPILLSPWYYYPSLPPYIDESRTEQAVVSPVTDPTVTPPVAQENPPTITDTPPPVTNTPPVTPADATPLKLDLDQAQKDLVSAWQDSDMAAVGRLVPGIGTVTVHVDGEDPYTLNAKDFFDLLHDGIQGTKTVSYVLDAPKMVNDDMATVVAHHTFLDPFGVQRVIDHTYTLVESPNGWIISDFSSGSYKTSSGNG